MSAPASSAPTWSGIVDDAAIFPPGDAALDDAVAAYTARLGTPDAELVASFVVTDVKVPQVGAPSIPLSVVVTGGAGAVAGALRGVANAGNPLAGLEVALRDPDDLAGNARRVVAAVEAARSDGLLDEATPVYVELPGDPSAGWLGAADDVAAAELRLKFRTGGLEAGLFPTEDALAARLDAALDRETPFKCTAGLHNAVRHTGSDGFEHHGFVNVLLATRRAFDGAPRDEVVATLAERDPDTLSAAAGEADLAGARRWFTSFGSCSVDEPRDDLRSLGLR